MQKFWYWLKRAFIDGDLLFDNLLIFASLAFLITYLCKEFLYSSQKSIFKKCLIYSEIYFAFFIAVFALHIFIVWLFEEPTAANILPSNPATDYIPRP